MRFALTDEQARLADAVRLILEAECPPPAVRSAGKSAEASVAGLWDTLLATGVLGMAAPAEYGGLDMGPCELVPVLEELGRAACPEPVAGHAAVAIPVLARWAPEPLAARWLGSAVSGEALRAASSPVDDLVVAARRADLLVLCRDTEVHAVPADQVTYSDQPSVDPARRAALVDWTPGKSTLVADDPEAVAAAIAVGIGGTLTMEVGGKLDPNFGAPLSITARVAAIGGGRFEVVMLGFESFDMGRAVLLEIGAVRLVVSEKRGVCGNHPIVYEHFGIDVAEARMVVVKTASNWQFFQPWISEVVRVDTPGATTSHLEDLPWRHLPRPIYPLDQREER